MKRPKTKKPALDRYVLFTNLRYVSVNGVRTMSNALLLEEDPKPLISDGPRRLARGFGPDPSWPTFDVEIPSIEYELRSGDSRESFMVLPERGPARPLFTGGLLRIKGGPTFSLIAENGDQSINIQTFEGPCDARTIRQVWYELPRQVARFWRAPAMPWLVYGSPTARLATLEADPWSRYVEGR